METKKTAAMCREVGVPTYTIGNWVRWGILSPPERDSSGHYLWTVADIERVRAEIAARSRRRVKTASSSPESNATA